MTTDTDLLIIGAGPSVWRWLPMIGLQDRSVGAPALSGRLRPALRDLKADWKLWSRAERVMASLFAAAMAIVLPVLPLLVVLH